MARSFNGSDQRMNINISVMAGGLPVTFACWFNPANTTTNVPLITATIQLGAGPSHFYALWARGDQTGDTVWATAYDGTASNAQTTAAFSASTWQHACAVFASTTSRAAYLNGGNKGTDTDTRGPTGMDYTSIAALRRSTIVYGNTQIAEAAIWNAALTDDEVALLGLGYSPLLVRPDLLTHYWPLIGRTSPEINLVNDYPMDLSASAPTVSDHPRVLYPARPRNVLKPASSPAGPTARSFGVVIG